MKNIVNCKKITAEYKDNKIRLGGPFIKEFITINERYTIKIEQFLIRTITITSPLDVPARDLYSELTKVEKLLMLFDGRFYPLNKLNLFDSLKSNDEKLKSFADELIELRLNYYISNSNYTFTKNRLLDFQFILTRELYNEWEVLLNSLDLIHQVYLYSSSDNKMPIDLNCAFLIGLAEPLSELTKKKTNPNSTSNSKSPTKLKEHIAKLIELYGSIIFSDELKDNYDAFLQKMTNSRHRVLHITKKPTYFNGTESTIYAWKMSLMYRVVMFSILKIEYSLYVCNLKEAVASIDSWKKNILIK